MGPLGDMMQIRIASSRTSAGQIALADMGDVAADSDTRASAYVNCDRLWVATVPQFIPFCGQFTARLPSTHSCHR
jgi:hypothetical protein